MGVLLRAVPRVWMVWSEGPWIHEGRVRVASVARRKPRVTSVVESALELRIHSEALCEVPRGTPAIVSPYRHMSQERYRPRLGRGSKSLTLELGEIHQTDNSCVRPNSGVPEAH